MRSPRSESFLCTSGSLRQAISRWGPAGAETLGQGQAILQFSKDGMQLTYKLITANIENITMAHIHLPAQPTWLVL